MAKAYVAAYEPMLTEEQWSKLAPLFPQATVSPRGGQQPIGDRHCFEGILWMLRYGAAWKALPKGYPSPSTCWRRLQEWADEDVLEEAWRSAARRVGRTRSLGLGGMLRGCDVHPGQKRGSRIGKTKRGKGTKLVVVADGEGVPLGLRVESASPHECTLVEATLDDVKVPPRDRRRKPNNVTRLIYDRAADSDPLRKRLAERGVELICPHRVNRSKPKLQDGRKLRRYRRRWKIERTFAWLQNYRRLVVRYERKPELFQAFVHVACILITLKRL